MKFTVNTKEFIEGVKSVSKALGKNVTNLVLAGLYVKAAGAGFSLRCFDLETDISVDIVAYDIEEGEILIADTRTLLRNIAKLPAKSNITIDAQDQDAGRFYGKLICGNTNIMIALTPTRNYPVARDLEGQSVWHIRTTAKALREPLSRVLVAAGRAGENCCNRPYLSGVCLVSSNEGISLTATDTFRLATDKQEGEADKQEARAIVPSSILLPLLAKLAKMSDNTEIGISIGDKIVEFVMEGASYSGWIMEGHFPDWEPLIPTSHLWMAEVSAEELLAAVARVRTMLRDELSAIQYSVIEGSLSLKGTCPELGEVTETVKLDLFEGEPPTVKLRALYVAEALKTMGSAKVVIEGQENRDPVMFTIEGNNNYKCIVMPISG